MDDYGRDRKPRAEEVEWEGIRREAGRRGLFHGTVTAYVIDPDGTPLASMNVADALRPENLER